MSLFRFFITKTLFCCCSEQFSLCWLLMNYSCKSTKDSLFDLFQRDHSLTSPLQRLHIFKVRESRRQYEEKVCQEEGQSGDRRGRDPNGYSNYQEGLFKTSRLAQEHLAVYYYNNVFSFPSQCFSQYFFSKEYPRI